MSPRLDTARWLTELAWPYSVCTHRPERASHTETVLSPEALQTLEEKGWARRRGEEWRSGGVEEWRGYGVG